MDAETLRRYSDLVLDVGANVQPGQIVSITADPAAARFVRAIADGAYRRRALFVDPWYFDPALKRVRLEHARDDTLEFIPPWYIDKLTELGREHAARITLAPVVPPGALDGIPPDRAGKDALPFLPNVFDVINARTTNWHISPWPSPDWARVVHPELDEDAAVATLWDELAYLLRLDAADPAEAWRARLTELHEAGRRLDELRLDALRFVGPGTDLTVGLLPTSRFAGKTAGAETVDGVLFAPNLPTEEIHAPPDPTRVDGVVTATKPLDVFGAVVRGLRVRFEGGRAVQIDADENADVLRARAQVDDGASRLGEVALVDREGRVGKTGKVFFNTLLDENAASHIALGNAYAAGVDEEDVPRINTSAIHVDFMIGGDDVTVTGLTRDGREVPVLHEGAWQL